MRGRLNLLTVYTVDGKKSLVELMAQLLLLHLHPNYSNPTNKLEYTAVHRWDDIFHLMEHEMRKCK